MGAAYYIVTEVDADEFATRIDGKALATASDRLDRIARKLDVPGIGSFVSVDAAEIADFLDDELEEDGTAPETRWFSPEEGLSAISTVIDHLTSHPDEALPQPDPVLTDLAGLRQALELARARGTRWRLAVDF